MTDYKFDTHIHTAEVSYCGSIKAKDVVRNYSESGYAGIVVTDHYYKGFFEEMGSMDWETKIKRYLEGYSIARAEGKKTGLEVLLGMELRFAGAVNEYLLYGIDEEFLTKNPELYKLNPEKLRVLTKGRNILTYQSHPFRPNMTTEHTGFADGIEVYNGNARHNSSNKSALRYAKDHGLLMISGSDFHETEDLARGGILTRKKATTQEEFINALKECTVDDLIMTE